MLEMRKMLDNFGIRLEFIEMESKGCFLFEMETIFVNQKLSKEEARRVIYHELKHALDHTDYVFLYKKPVPLMKMESEANEYMVRKIIEENGGIYNYTQLIQEFKIGMGTDVNYTNR